MPLQVSAESSKIHYMTGTTKEQKRATPWAIRGVSMEARNAAMTAAKRDSVTLGEWLDRAIRQQIKASRVNVPAVPLEDTLAALVKQMQADREERQRDKEATAARIEALEVKAVSTSPNLIARLYGALRGSGGHT